jgi:hypothetical protein
MDAATMLFQRRGWDIHAFTKPLRTQENQEWRWREGGRSRE